MLAVIDKLLRVVPVIFISGALGLAVYAGWVVMKARTSLSQATANPVAANEIVRPQPDMISAEAWNVFKTPAVAATGGADHDRFRLAGTFFVMGADGDGSERKRLAILDDVPANRQHMVSEGQAFEDYEIVRIYQDRLIMRRDGLEIELQLSFQEAVSAMKPEKAASDTAADPEEVVLESNRFGKRIGETRWVIQKQALVDYYYELLDEPERIAAIYASLKPDYENGSIVGHYLESEGEAEFFQAVGLQEGDRIRRVNSMNMTSQARAEYFISEFMQDRLGAVVLDIIRDEKEEKLIYMMR
jgi:type II secretion system protein C